MPPGGSRQGIGSLVLGFYDPLGRLHYAGSVGTGFSDRELLDYSLLCEALSSTPPASLVVAGDQLDRSIRWIRLELVVEVSLAEGGALHRGLPHICEEQERQQQG
jgi:bifunctional non-homologous end joining protein LigD